MIHDIRGIFWIDIVEDDVVVFQQMEDKARTPFIRSNVLDRVHISLERRLGCT